MEDLNKMASILLEYERIRANAAIDPSSCRDLADYIQKKDWSRILKLPFLALEDTVCGKKEKYARIAEAWVQEKGDISGWGLLALADTLESMSKMLYEHYRTLQDLFRSKLDEYLSQECSLDVLAGVAILKACRLELVPAERYAQEGKRRMKFSDGNSKEGMDWSMGKAFENLAGILWDEIKETWGLEDGE